MHPRQRVNLVDVSVRYLRYCAALINFDPTVCSVFALRFFLTSAPFLRMPGPVSVIQVAVWPFDSNDGGDQLRLWNLAIGEYHQYGALRQCGDTIFYDEPLPNGAPIL